MLKNNRVVALIPARAGSKRLKNKNLLLLSKKPLIAWTIEAALTTSFIDDVIVSTDSVEIMQAAVEHGATVPFVRPKSLAHDTASTDDVLMHAIDELKLMPTDIIILLQPTSPLRDSEAIESALSQLTDHVQGVVSVCECEHSPMWSNTLPESKLMSDFIGHNIAAKRSQDLPTFYRLNGAIYAYRVSFLNRYKTRFYSEEVIASIMPANKSVDVDSLVDFKFAEFLMEQEK